MRTPKSSTGITSLPAEVEHQQHLCRPAADSTHRDAVFDGRFIIQRSNGLLPSLRQEVTIVALVSLMTPSSEIERLTTVALLQANGIDCLVRGGAYGGLFPGGQPGSFNAQTILVPEQQLEAARLLLAAEPLDDEPNEASPD